MCTSETGKQSQVREQRAPPGPGAGGTIATIATIAAGGAAPGRSAVHQHTRVVLAVDKFYSSRQTLARILPDGHGVKGSWVGLFFFVFFLFFFSSFVVFFSFVFFFF